MSVETSTVYQYLHPHPLEEITDLELFSEWDVNGPDLVWVDLIAAGPESAKKILGDVFHFHSLAIDDCREQRHHPKLVDYKDYLFVIHHAIWGREAGGVLETQSIAFFIGRNFLVTYRHAHSRSIQTALTKFKNEPDTYRDGHAESLYIMIVREMILSYRGAIDNLGEQVVKIENQILTRATRSTLAQIMSVRKDTARLIRVTKRQMDVMNQILEGKFKQVTEAYEYELHELYDRLSRALERALAFRDSSDAAFEAFSTAMLYRQSRLLDLLTTIAFLLIPYFVLSGLYAMNFEHLPFIESKLGFYELIGCMTLGGGLLIFIARKFDPW